ncbi:lipase chaperone [Nocardioides sp. Iso805N]|uniref:lipase chaperone n=1 Tax=Nocardioides sp. Iso805N TaxID=1283287 RepID=UPI000366B7F3|nr:lipase chaperone [Nocardioides sp. Iso805N]
MSRRVKVTTVAALAVASLAALSGCGSGSGSDDAASGPRPSGAASTPGSAAATPSEAASSPSPSQSGLTGPVATLDAGTVRAPAGWTLKPGDAAWQLVLTGPVRKGGQVIYADLDDHVFGTSASPTPAALDAVVKVVHQDKGLTWTRRPNVTLGGVLFYHLVDDTNDVLLYEEYGSIHNGRDVVLDFEFEKPLVKASERRRLIDAMAASYQPS